MGESYTDNICNRIEIYAPNQLGVLVKKIKVEVGNRATDWSPAPEDMATLEEVNDVYTLADSAENKAVNAQTLIDQLSDSIATLVTDSNGESLMVQTESGWTFSTKQIQDTVDMTSESLDLLTKDMGDINSAVGILQQAVSDLGVLSKYVKITTYEDEPCIELGEGDSDFKLLITNTRILFMEGSNILAYMANQEVHIKKTVIEEELQQGGFVWKVRSNGNMGLMWKGVSS